MDEDLARIVATTGLRASRELGDLARLLAEYRPDDEALRAGIAAAIHEIHLATCQPAFTAYPALEAEFGARIERYGRAT